MEMNKKALALLSVGHLVTDLNPGALPILLPFFKESLHLSYTMAGVILLFSNLTSSVIQPVFGYFSDKHPRGWILPLAPFACLPRNGGHWFHLCLFPSDLGRHGQWSWDCELSS